MTEPGLLSLITSRNWAVQYSRSVRSSTIGMDGAVDTGLLADQVRLRSS